jgi:hypothetical protein
MKSLNLAVIAVLVGAIGLAPTELPSAQAAATATVNTLGLQVATKQYGVVAGASPAATTAAAYSIPAFITSCTVSNQTSGPNPSGSTTITMSSVTGYVVGMRPIATGISASALITSIKSTAPRNIVISIATTASLPNNTAITGGGCWQQYFSVNNIQSYGLNSFGIQQTFTSISPDTIAMQRCSGTWTEATGACSGTITTIVSGTSTSAITTVGTPLTALTGTTRLRLSASKSGVSVSISVFVRLATDIPAGATSNS